MTVRIFWVFTIGVIIISGCSQSNTQAKKLPYLGPLQVSKDGGQIDSQYYTVPPFSFVDQDSEQVTQATFDGKIYVTDFFFTTCPSICPKMKQQMLRIYQEYGDNDTLLLLSHTIDPKHDTVEVLKKYAQKLSVDAPKWRFVTGDRSDIYNMAKDYFISVAEDSTLEGGYAHSGYFALVDKENHIRGYYDGTSPEKVDDLMDDIEVLLREYR